MANPDLVQELLPKPGDPGVGKKVFQLLEVVISDKQELGLHEKWRRSYRYGRNKGWEQDKTSTGVPLSSVNFVHLHRQRTVNTLTDNNPTFNVARVGTDGDDEDVYAMLQQAAAWWWAEQEQQAALAKSILNGETYGVAVEKVAFNPDLEYGTGEVETTLVDPYHFGVYPPSCVDVQKAEAVLHFYPMSLREARRRWPDMAESIKPDSALIDEIGDVRREAQAGDGKAESFVGKFGNVFKSIFNKSDKSNTDCQDVMVCECWCKDYTMTSDGPLFPGFIRCVTACNDGKIVLDDRPNPSISPKMPEDQAMRTYLYDKFPFTVAQSLDDPTTIWGMSDFEQLEQLQQGINKCLSQILYHKDRAARPKIINPKDSGVPNTAFTNIQGIINPVSMSSAQGIRYLEFSNNLSDIQAVLQLLQDLFFKVSGTFELDQAQAPGRDVIAAKAIAQLLERAALMMRGKLRAYDRLIRERGRMYISHVQNWYTEDRWISFDEDGETKAVAINGEKMRVPARLTVVSGSTMPVSQIQQRDEALALFDKGVIDREALLEKLDWSGRQSVIKRMNEGPVGDLVSRLGVMGVPPELLQAIQEAAAMDRKDFDKAAEAGEIPTLPIGEQQEQGPDPATAAQLNEMQGNMEKTQAEIQEVMAKVDLINAQTETERVKQQVAMHGIEYDRNAQDMDRVKTIADVKSKSLRPGDTPSSGPKNADMIPGKQEHGLRSDNREVL